VAASTYWICVQDAPVHGGQFVAQPVLAWVGEVGSRFTLEFLALLSVFFLTRERPSNKNAVPHELRELQIVSPDAQSDQGRSHWVFQQPIVNLAM
jgi:hypothetical protein